MMKGILFLVFKYLRPKKSIISILTYLSILGPLTGVCVLIVITSVMNGFPVALQKKIIEYESDISIVKENHSTITTPNTIIKKLNEQNIKASPTTKFYGFIQHKDMIIPVQTKGILPQKDQYVSQLKNYISIGSYELKQNECLIGEGIAQQYGLQIGEKIILHSPQRYASLIKIAQKNKNDNNSLVEANQTLTLTIRGFFAYGYSTVDNNCIYIHIDDANDMVGINWGEAQEIETAIPKPFEAIEESKSIKENEPSFSHYRFIPWQDKHKDYYETVQREKKLITFTLFFIMIGAAIGIASTLFSLVIQKTKEIGILKSLGVSRKEIILIFLLQGSIIGLIGSLIGLGLSFIILNYRNEIFKFLWNSNAYFLTDIPLLIVKKEVVIITITACLICILGALLPAIFASFIKTTQALSSDK